MPVFYQQDINETTRLGIWKIEEDELFFKQHVPVHRDVSHPHKRLQHLAGRFLLQNLFPDFPFSLIKIADTQRPFLPDETYQFSISHCNEYAAAIVSTRHRVGIDVEIPSEKVRAVQNKFIGEEEKKRIHPLTIEEFTKIWSAKEAVYKWYGLGKVDFKQHIRLCSYDVADDTFNCFFEKNKTALTVVVRLFPELCLSYVLS